MFGAFPLVSVLHRAFLRMSLKRANKSLKVSGFVCNSGKFADILRKSMRLIIWKQK